MEQKISIHPNGILMGYVKYNNNKGIFFLNDASLFKIELHLKMQEMLLAPIILSAQKPTKQNPLTQPCMVYMF